MNNVLVLQCSPHVGGVSDSVATLFTKGMAEAGIETRTVALRDYAYSPCTGCGGCSRPPHKCILANQPLPGQGCCQAGICDRLAVDQHTVAVEDHMVGAALQHASSSQFARAGDSNFVARRKACHRSYHGGTPANCGHHPRIAPSPAAGIN